MFESWTPGEEVVLVANPDYREGPPELDRVIFKIIPEESVAAMAMEKGELDIMELTLSNTLERFRANEDLVVQETPATSIGYLNMKTATEPFSDVRVRRAVAHALDKQEIVRAVSGDMRKVVNSPIPEGMFGHTDDVHTYDYDPERAAALLTEAGYPDGFETSAFITDSDVYRQLYTAIQAYLAEVGIDMELETMDSATWVERTTAGEAPIAPLGLSARPDPDAILSGFFHGSVSSPQGRNFTWWDGADDLIDQARREMDTERRRELYIEIQQLMTKQLPTIPMSQGVNILAYQEGVKGHTPGKVGDNWLYETRIEPD
jgi:peptide/nickel transport system substrate-binding protein